MANRINVIDWEKNAIAKIGIEIFCSETGGENGKNPEINWDDANDVGTKLRPRIEPWLTALVQSEHLSLLVGSGLSTAVSKLAGTSSQGMQAPAFTISNDKIQQAATESAAKTERGEANAEDVFRVAIELLRGLEISKDTQAEKLKQEISSKLEELLNGVLKGEQEFLKAYEQEKEKTTEAFLYLKSFLLSFTSRVASRDRLHIFTTNYDRFIEYAMDDAGILWLDRFRGMLRPVFRNSRLDLDFHYNPPGIRGEPRYVEGVSKITKLHGSLDWTFDGKNIHREPMPFGAEALPKLFSVSTEQKRSSEETYKPLIDSVAVYPNSAKDMETAFYPYAELFRDFSAAICRPNSVIVTYGYGFGDDHINRVLQEMLTIPSTHLLIISWKVDVRIKKFFQKCNSAQISLLLGEPFAGLSNLVNFYLPKPGIDRITQQLVKIKENRDKAGLEKQESPSENSETEEKDG